MVRPTVQSAKIRDTQCVDAVACPEDRIDVQLEIDSRGNRGNGRKNGCVTQHLGSESRFSHPHCTMEVTIPRLRKTIA